MNVTLLGTASAEGLPGLFCRCETCKKASLKCALDTDLMAFTLHLVVPEEPFIVAGYEAFPLRANHDGSRVCLNYVLRSPSGESLLYASDTGWYDDATWRLLESFQLDGIIVECTQKDEGGYPGHLSIPEVARMRHRLLAAGALRPEAPVVATHFSHHIGLMHDELEALLAPHGIRAAYDGMMLQVDPAQ